jgi:aryl-alcohol dehydrogenase-like predicted oxidoreductase
VGRLDLVYLHWWDWSKEGFVGAVRALEAMKARGVVKDVGLTNVDVSRLRPLLEEEDGPEIACVQVNLSVIDHRPSSSGLCELCAAHGVRLLAHGSLAGGLLSDDWLGRDPPDYASLGPGVASNRVLVDEFGGWDRFQRVLRCLRAVADRHAAAPGPLTKVTVAMVAVAWTLKQTGVSAVVLGCVECNRWFGGSWPNLRILSLSHIEVDSADFWTNRSLSSSSRSEAKELASTLSHMRTLKSG